MDNPLTLDNLPPEPTKLGLDTIFNGHVSDDSAENIAAKATYGLSGVWGRNQEEIKQGIKNGEEDQLRREAASQLDSAVVKNVTDAIRANPSNALNLLTAVKPTNPNTVFEYNFSKRYVDLMYNLSEGNPNSNLTSVGQAAPDASALARKDATNVIAQGQIVQRYIKEAKDAYDSQSTAGAIVDYTKGFVPFLAELEERGRVPGVGTFEGWGRGENLRLQYEKLLGARNPDEFRDLLEAAVRPLINKNPGLAVQFLNDLFDYSTSGRWMNNIQTLFDAALNIGIPKAGFNIAKTLILRTEENQSLKNVIASVKNTDAVPIAEAAHTAAGDLEGAATKKVARQIVVKTVGPTDHAKEQIERLQQDNRLDAQHIRDNPGNYGTERANRLADKTEGWFSDFLQRLQLALKVERVPIARLAEPALKTLNEELDKMYNGWDNQIINRGSPWRDPLTNTWHRTIYFGSSKAKLFDTEAQAKNAASDLPSAKTFGEGNKWGFYVTQPVKEDMISRIDIPGGESHLGLINSVASWFRTPEDTLSRNQNILRKVATYAPSIAFKEVQKRLKDLQKLSIRAFKGTEGNARYHRWLSIVKDARNHWDPTIAGPDQGPENRGYFYQSPGEFEAAYSLMHPGHLPTHIETDAYFAMRGVLEAERAINNIRIYRQLNSLGAEQFRVFTGSSSPLEQAKKYTQWFNGVKVPGMPRGDEPVVIVHNNERDISVHQRGSTIQGKRKEEIEKGLQDGTWHHIQIVDPERRPLQDWSREINSRKVQHILVKAEFAERKDLDILQIPRRGGGHFDYDYPQWIKTAHVTEEKWGKSLKHRYEGDIAIMPAKIHAEGADLVKRFNEVRELIARSTESGDFSAARALWDTFNNKGLSFDEFHSWFKPSSKIVNGKKVGIPARLKLTEPFHLVSEGKTIWDMDKQLERRYVEKDSITGKETTTLTNDTKVGMMRGLTVTEHTKQRDSYDMISPKNDGTVANPMYNYHPAELVDPVPSMNRAMQKAIHGYWMDDYKTNGMRAWVEEANKLQILETSDKALKDAPYWYFNHPEYKKGADPKLISQFEANRLKIREFVGYRHMTDTLLDSLAQQLSDMSYKTLGPGKMQLLPAWMLANSKNATRVLRSAVFHPIMGMFNIAQFGLHLATYANVYGIAGPVRATQGALGGFLHGLAWFNKSPEFLNLLDKIASKLGVFKPGEWKEAHDLLHNSGFSNEFGEYVLKDSSMTAKVVKSTAGEFLDWGQMFFRGGVRGLRVGSFYTAFKEFRAENPLGRLSEAHAGSILNRADLLSHNMSRASSSFLNSGILSIPFQFYSYFLRLAEMMWSGGLLGNGRLTRIEKLRLFGVNAVLFGFPAATGLVGYHFEDQIRDAAREHGHVVGENFITSFLMNGLPAAIGAIIDGQGDWTHGQWMNFSERWGPGKGWEGIDKILQTDKSYWDWIGGAVGSKGGETLSNLTNFTKAMYAGITQDPAYFATGTDMLLDMLREANGFNYMYAGYTGILTHKLIDKKGQWVSNITTAKALLLATTGLKDRRASDIYAIEQQMKYQEQVTRYFENKFDVEFRRWAQAMKDNNLEEARAHYMAAFGALEAGDIPYFRRSQIVQRAGASARPLIETIPEQYYQNWRNIPPSQEKTRSDADRQRTILQRNTGQ